MNAFAYADSEQDSCRICCLALVHGWASDREKYGRPYFTVFLSILPVFYQAEIQ